MASKAPVGFKKRFTMEEIGMQGSLYKPNNCSVYIETLRRICYKEQHLRTTKNLFIFVQ